MAKFDRRSCRIYDGVRDSKIHWDTRSNFDRKTDSSEYGRVFPRPYKGDDITGYNNKGFHNQSLLDSFTQHCEEDEDPFHGFNHKRSGTISSNEEIESWFLDYMEKEAPSLGVYRRNTESESIIIRFKRNLPVFDGFWQSEDLLSWIDAIEDFFEETNPPEQVKCKIVWSKMKGRAYYWWKMLQDERLSEGKNPISSWSRMRKLLISKFAPSSCSTKLPNPLGNPEKSKKEIDEMMPTLCLIKVPSENSAYDNEIVNGQQVVEVIQGANNILAAENYEEENIDDDLEEITCVGFNKALKLSDHMGNELFYEFGRVGCKHFDPGGIRQDRLLWFPLAKFPHGHVGIIEMEKQEEIIMQEGFHPNFMGLERIAGYISQEQPLVRFWKLDYVLNNQKFKLSSEVKIAIGLEDIARLVRIEAVSQWILSKGLLYSYVQPPTASGMLVHELDISISKGYQFPGGGESYYFMKELTSDSDFKQRRGCYPRSTVFYELLLEPTPIVDSPLSLSEVDNTCRFQSMSESNGFLDSMSRNRSASMLIGQLVKGKCERVTYTCDVRKLVTFLFDPGGALHTIKMWRTCWSSRMDISTVSDHYIIVLLFCLSTKLHLAQASRKRERFVVINRDTLLRAICNDRLGDVAATLTLDLSFSIGNIGETLYINLPRSTVRLQQSSNREESLHLHYILYITRGRVIPREGCNDVNRSSMGIMIECNIALVSSYLSSLCENGQYMELKLFHKTVNGLDPPIDLDSACTAVMASVWTLERSLVDELFVWGDGLM